MIMTLTGENSFGLGQAVTNLIDTFVIEHGDLALQQLDGQEATIDQLSEALTSLPFLSTKKMVVLRAPSANKQFTEQSEQLFTRVPDGTDLLLVESKLDKRLSYYKYLKKHTDFHEFLPLDPSGLANWLVTAARAKNGTISPVDARYLVERAGSNQQLLSNELEKLLLHDPNITRRTIDLLTVASPQSTIFQLLEAAFAGQTRRVLDLYAEQRALKVEPAQIISMLAWQLHVLAILKTAGDRPTDQVAREAKLNPYVLTKSQTIARRLTLSQLKILIANLLHIDRQTKRTSLDPDEALTHYLLTLSK